VWHVHRIDVGEQTGANGVAVGVKLSESRIAGLKSVDAGESAEQVIEAVVLHDHHDQMFNAGAGGDCPAPGRLRRRRTHAVDAATSDLNAQADYQGEY